MTAFWHWWQHLPDHIDPVVFSIGSFKLQYYGLMYLVAFGFTYALVRYRIRNEGGFTIKLEEMEGLMTALIFGVILGGRLGYVLFYNISHYMAHPLEIFLPFDIHNHMAFTGLSGMSYHGGLIGVILAAVFFTRKHGIPFWETADLFAPTVPLGYTFGRLGNFINGELFGRVTTAPIGMYFPLAGDGALRHPSQLYEAFCEGVLLFLVLWFIRKRPHPQGSMLAFYLIGYGCVRFFVEFAREPDSHLGFVFMGFSQGQILCSLMTLGGCILYVYLSKRPAGQISQRRD